MEKFKFIKDEKLKNQIKFVNFVWIYKYLIVYYIQESVYIFLVHYIHKIHL